MYKETFTLKVHECCGDDELRPLLMCVHFKDGYAYASDGHVVIKQSLEYHTINNPEHLEGKSLHKDNFKAVMGFEVADCDDVGIACSDNDGRTAFFEFFDRKGQEMPNFDATMTPREAKPVDFIGINPKYLTMLSKAMHAPFEAYRFRFQGNDNPILIDVPDIPNQTAILMPVTLNDTLW